MAWRRRVIPRAEWGAIHPNGAGPALLPAEGVYLHHSVTIAPDLNPPFDDDYAAIRALERIGQQRFGAGISYTFPITPIGLIFEGHGVNRRGTHTGGFNTTHRAICFVGNYETNHPTPQQLESAAWLLAHGFLSRWWKAAKLTGGHRDVKGTACPGRHAYARMGDIDRRAAQIVDELVGRPQPPPAKPTPAPIPPPEDDDMPVIIRSSGGFHLLSGGRLVGIKKPADITALKAAGIKETGPLSDETKAAFYKGFNVEHG